MRFVVIAASWRVPSPLAPGARVQVLAPSSPAREADVAAGAALLREAGLEVRVGPACAPAADASYLRGSDAERRAVLQQAIDDPGVEAIWAARGGYGAARLLPGLDTAALARAPKWLVGFSDASALHAAWAGRQLVSLHAANVNTLAGWSAQARAELFAWLRRPAPLDFVGTPHGGGRAAGRLWGGNLAVLASLCGTGQLPNLDGTILFVEDVGERPYRLDRLVTQLRQSGVLAQAAGVAVGQLTDCAPAVAGDTDALGAVQAALAGLGLPLVAGLEVGHAACSRLLPLGLPGVLDADAGTLRVG